MGSPLCKSLYECLYIIVVNRGDDIYDLDVFKLNLF